MENPQQTTAGSGSNQVNLKYKTSKCRHYEQTGNCQLGDRCHFAHGDIDLRTMNQPIPKEKIEFAQNPVQYHKPTGTAMPKSHTNGGTSQMLSRGGGRGRGGDMHSQFQSQPHSQFMPGQPMQWQPKGQVPQFPMGPGPQGMDMMNGMQRGVPQLGGYANFKTVKCKFFDQGKNCPYKDKCSFAHGEQDLRMPPPGAPLMGHGLPNLMGPPPMPIPQQQQQSPFMVPGGLFGAYPMPVDMMHSPQQQTGSWDPNAFNPMMMGGMMSSEMSYMMGQGHGGYMMGGGPQGGMMGGSLGPMQCQFDIPIRFSFPNQTTGPDGQIINKTQMMDVYFIDKSLMVQEELSQAQRLNAENKFQDCLNLLMNLHQKKLVLIQQVDPLAQQQVSHPFMGGMMMPQQPVQ